MNLKVDRSIRLGDQENTGVYVGTKAVNTGLLKAKPCPFFWEAARTLSYQERDAPLEDSE